MLASFTLWAPIPPQSSPTRRDILPVSDSLQPLLIAAADLWEMIMGSLFFILYIIVQLVGNRGEAKKKPKRKPRGRLPQAEAPVPVAPPRNQEEALRSEVEEFLRRAEGKTAKKKPPAPPQPQRQPVKETPFRLGETKQPVPAPTLRKEGVAEHVTRHISSQDMVEHTAQLGQDIGQTDDRVRLRLHDKFEHRLGTLKHEEIATKIQPKANVAAEIASMLSNPEGMRQLIVANEILRRPEW